MQPTLEQKDIELETILKDTDLQLEVDVNPDRAGSDQSRGKCDRSDKRIALLQRSCVISLCRVQLQDGH